MISVVVPTYNRTEKLMLSVDSVSRCLGGYDYEIIVVDNGNKSDLRDKLKKYERVRYFHKKNFKNAAQNRNFGIKQAKGKYIAFQDDDDQWTEFDIEEKIALLESTNSVLVYSNGEYRGPNFKGVRKYFLKDSQKINGDAYYKLISRLHYPIPTPTVIVKAEALKKTKGFNESLSVAEDVYLWISLSLLGDFAYYPEVTVLINRDGTNISSIPSEKRKAQDLVHKDSELMVLKLIKQDFSLNENQSKALDYIISLKEGTKLPDIPKEFLKLEAEYNKSTAGVANKILRIITFNNDNLYNSTKSFIVKILKPVRKSL